jgi:hypothetical protein
VKKCLCLSAILVLLTVLVCSGWGADSTISRLPDGGASISTSDMVPIVQSGITKRVTISDILSLVTASQPWTSTGDLTSTGAVATERCKLGGGVVVTNDGANDCTLKCYDSSNAASGTTLFPEIYCQKDYSRTCFLPSLERGALNGIYCVVTTSGSCTYGLGYKLGW